MRLALVFPGQGSQSVGMGRTLTGTATDEVFQIADEALGGSLATLIADGPADQLDLTENSQPAILAIVHRAVPGVDRGGRRGRPAGTRRLRGSLHGPVQRHGRRRRPGPGRWRCGWCVRAAG